VLLQPEVVSGPRLTAGPVSAAGFFVQESAVEGFGWAHLFKAWAKQLVNLAGL